MDVRRWPARHQPRDGGVVDAVAARNVRQGLARLPPPDSLGNLERRELRFPAEPDAALHSTYASVAGAGLDQLPLELRQPDKDGEQQAAVLCSGVGSTICERFEHCAGLADRVEDIEQVPGTAR